LPEGTVRRLWVATLLLAGCLDHQALQRHRQAYVRAHDCVATWHQSASQWLDKGKFIESAGFTLFDCDSKQEILVEDVDGKPWGP
jgi:uncharacterized protein YcfL